MIILFLESFCNIVAVREYSDLPYIGDIIEKKTFKFY